MCPGCRVQPGSGRLQPLACGRRIAWITQLSRGMPLPRFGRVRHANCQREVTQFYCRGAAMDLTIWLPAMLLLGLAVVGLMFLFVVACDKV